MLTLLGNMHFLLIFIAKDFKHLRTRARKIRNWTGYRFISLLCGLLSGRSGFSGIVPLCFVTPIHSEWCESHITPERCGSERIGQRLKIVCSRAESEIQLFMHVQKAYYVSLNSAPDYTGLILCSVRIHHVPFPYPFEIWR